MKDELEEMRDWALSRIDRFTTELKAATDPAIAQQALYNIQITVEHAHDKFKRVAMIEEAQSNGTLPA